MPSIVTRAETLLLRTLLGLPSVALRVLAGRPVVADGQTMEPEAQLTLRLRQLLRKPSSEDLPVAEGRIAMRNDAQYVGSGLPIGSARDIEVPGAAGRIPARVYTPRTPTDGALLVYIHGGSMMLGDLDSHDGTCRFLAEQAAVTVVALDYRLAPEHLHPAAPEDCFAAYRHIVEHAADFGAEPGRIAVGGDSAGGYFSALTALRAAREGVPCAFQLLVYPVTDPAVRSRSHELFEDGFYLSRRGMDRARNTYFGDYDQHAPDAAIVNTKDFPDGLAPAYVATAGFDPLRDEGEDYARLLADNGFDVELKRFPGLMHGFFNIVAAGRVIPTANAEIAAKVKSALH